MTHGFIRTLSLVALLILPLQLLAALHAQTNPATNVQPAFRDGELLVKFKSDVGARAAHANARAQRLVRIGRLEHVRLAAGMDVEGMRRWYERQADVEYAEPNYIVHKVAAPNDTSFSQQWGMLNTGQLINGTRGTAGADINASAAWARHTGSGAVVVAVIDTGIDYTHPDLSANIWSNLREIPGDGIDNDGNGKIDDSHGWDFANNDADPMDDDADSHGTHVAGIIGATGNNARGVSGVNWNVQLMSLKVLRADGIGDLASIIAAIDYAIAHEVAIINASYAFDCGAAPSRSELEAMNRAREKGILLVMAAGNDGCDNDISPTYPASHALNNVLSVGASDQFDSRALYSRALLVSSSSSFGAQSVHLFAPGKNIYSTLRAADYGFESGTSMAAPHVSGAAALLKSYRPSLSLFQVREILLKTAQAKPALSNLAVTGGRLNAGLAMDYDLNASTPIQPSHLVAIKIDDSRIDLSWLDDSTIETGWKLEYRNDPNLAFSTTPRATLAATTLIYSDTAAQAGEGTYNGYRIRAYNGVGDSNPTAEIKLITPPLFPDNLQLAGLDSTARLTWSDRSSRETSYLVERAINGGLFNEIANLPANTTRFDDRGLTLGTQYSYRVRASSSVAGYSAYSNVLDFSPQTSIGSGGGGCFIATAAFGSALHPKVNVLRQFRDHFLMPNLLGRAFVRAYYRTSPPVADFIARHEWLRAGVRTFLWPLVWLVEAIMPEAQAGGFFRPPETSTATTEQVERITAELVAERQLLVKFTPAVNASSARTLLQSQGAKRVETISPQLYLAEFNDSAGQVQAVRELSLDSRVEYVEANRVVSRPRSR